jgi:hypothetical protein
MYRERLLAKLLLLALAASGRWYFHLESRKVRSTGLEGLTLGYSNQSLAGEVGMLHKKF